MRNIRIATSQFEHRAGDKAHNLGRIRELTCRAAPRCRDRLLPRMQRDGLHLSANAHPRRAGRAGRAGPGRPVGPDVDRYRASRESWSWPA